MFINTLEMNYDIVNLTAKAVAVLNNLVFRSNSKTNSCFPGLKTIAKDCKLSVRSVQRALDELLEAGIIQKKHNYRENGSQTTNIYTIIVKASERVAAAKNNAMQKMNDMKKRLSQKTEKENKDFKKSGSKKCSKGKNNELSFMNSIGNLLKFSCLARGGSHSDQPIT